MSKELMNTTEMKEVISKRTACMKVFEHADHRFTAAIYGTPVHYMKDGRWEEIDNRFGSRQLMKCRLMRMIWKIFQGPSESVCPTR